MNIYYIAARNKAVSNPMQDSSGMQQQQQTIITSTPTGQQVTVIPASANVRAANVVQVFDVRCCGSASCNTRRSNTPAKTQGKCHYRARSYITRYL